MRKHFIHGWAARGLGLALAAGAALAPMQQAQAAAYATGGTGKYRNEILWLTWGGGVNGTDGVALANGAQTTATLQVANGQQIQVTCTLSNLNGALSSYRSGDYSGDGLEDMYNIDGTGGANNLVAGLATAMTSTASFDIDCSATRNGASYPIPGLVIADAESLESTLDGNGVPSEYIRGTAAGNWNVLEMFAGNGNSYTATKTTNGGSQTMEFGPGGQGSGTSPVALSYLTFTTPTATPSMSFAMRGGGITAMSIGLLVPRADYGDAPSSYGTAAHLFYDWVHGNDSGVSASGTNINDASFRPGGLSPLTTDHLGTVGPDGEPGTSSSDNAYGIAGANEENGWPTSPAINAGTAGTTLTRSIACSGTGTVAGWIDFDGNGTFDSDERAAGTCSGANGTASLSWTVPNDIQAGTTWVRLRYAQNASEVASPSGTATSGEVEDAQITIAQASANLVVTKTNTPAAGASDQANDTVVKGSSQTYTIVVTNNGPQPANGAIVRDPVSSGLTCTSASCTGTTNGAACPTQASGSALLGALQSSGGAAIPALPNTGTVTLTVTCTVN